MLDLEILPIVEAPDVSVGPKPPLNDCHFDPLRGVCSAKEVHDDGVQSKAGRPDRVILP
jgi:hypothetical protein